MIKISNEHLAIVLNILQEFVHDCEVRVFGSRYHFTAREYSDLDLIIVGTEKLDYKVFADLKEAFEESNLPFRVDVLDWHAISDEFRQVIEKGYEVIQQQKALGVSELVQQS
jgi:predicted nucleotidyltransferase